MITETIFGALESSGRRAYDVAVKYGPVYVDILSKSTAKICEFFNFSPFNKLPLALHNLLKSSDEILYLSGRGFFESGFGRFTVKSLDTCTYSCERLLKRLELATKDTVIVLRSESCSSKSLINSVHQSSITKDAMVAPPPLDGKPTESLQQVPEIEPSTVRDHPILSSETEESSAVEADPESEKDTLAEFISSSNLTIVYENVTGLEKAFVFLYDVLLLCPVSAAVAFIRFMKNIVRDLEECFHASKVNVTLAGRRVKNCSSLKTDLKNRLKTLYSDIVDSMKPSESVLRLESKKSVGSSDSNGGLLSNLMDSVTFYWEENDPDYVPIYQSSDSCTESGESETDISVEEINGLLSIKEKNPEKTEKDPEKKNPEKTEKDPEKKNPEKTEKNPEKKNPEKTEKNPEKTKNPKKTESERPIESKDKDV